MASGGFLSTEAVVVLACITLLAILSALALAPLGRRLGGRRRQVVAFLGCLAGIWAVAVLGIALIRRSI